MSAATPTPWSDGGVVTGEAVALDLRPARLPSRLLGRALDAALQLVALVVLSGVVVASAPDSAVAAAGSLVVTVLVLVGYPVALESLWGGRTVGKAALGLRVVRDDGAPLRLRHAVVRALVGVFVDTGITLGLGGLLCGLLHPAGKRIGDVLAGTVAVHDRVPVPATGWVTPRGVADALLVPPALAAWAAGADLSGVGPELVALSRQLLTRERELRPEALEALGSRVAADLRAAVAPPPPEGTPGWALVRAVVAERRRRSQQ